LGLCPSTFVDFSTASVSFQPTPPEGSDISIAQLFGLGDNAFFDFACAGTRHVHSKHASRLAYSVHCTERPQEGVDGEQPMEPRTGFRSMYIEAKSHTTAGKMGKPPTRFRPLEKLDNGRWARLPFVRCRTKGRLKSATLDHRYDVCDSATS